MLAQQSGWTPLAAQYANPAGFADPKNAWQQNEWGGPLGGEYEPPLDDPFTTPDPVEVINRNPNTVGGGGRAAPGPGTQAGNPGVGGTVADTPLSPTFYDYDYTPSWLSSFYTPYTGGGGMYSPNQPAGTNPGVPAPVLV